MVGNRERRKNSKQISKAFLKATQIPPVTLFPWHSLTYNVTGCRRPLKCDTKSLKLIFLCILLITITNNELNNFYPAYPRIKDKNDISQ